MMLSCREITERASDLLDGTLPWRVRVEIRLHLMMCRFCREYVRQMELLLRTLRRLPPEEPSPELQRELLTAFRAERE
jgi:predicted anti-sigma-YlaC factor YlaD